MYFVGRGHATGTCLDGANAFLFLVLERIIVIVARVLVVVVDSWDKGGT